MSVLIVFCGLHLPLPPWAANNGKQNGFPLFGDTKSRRRRIYTVATVFSWRTTVRNICAIKVLFETRKMPRFRKGEGNDAKARDRWISEAKEIGGIKSFMLIS